MTSGTDSSEEYLRFTTLAFYEGRWVFIPMFYVPKRAYDPASGILRFFYFEVLDGSPPLSIPSSKCNVRGLTPAIEEKWMLAKETLIPLSMPDQELKEVCRKNGIPIGWVKKGLIRKSLNKSSKTSRRLEKVQRKSKPLNVLEYRKMRRELRKISSQSALICEILWYVNEKFKEGTYLTLEEVVRLMVENVAPDDENFLNWVDFYRDVPGCGHALSTYFPEKLWKRLCLQIQEDSLFVFSTGTGGPISSMQVEKHIKEAAKRAGIERSVTAISFRPSFNGELRKKALKSRVDIKFKPYLEPVSEEDWRLICNEFPEISEGRGRTPSYDPRVMINALLKSMKENISLAKVSSSPAFREALKSQKRRWEKNELLEKIIGFRKRKLPS